MRDDGRDQLELIITRILTLITKVSINITCKPTAN